jgi:hypothetical protein
VGVPGVANSTKFYWKIILVELISKPILSHSGDTPGCPWVKHSFQVIEIIEKSKNKL